MRNFFGITLVLPMVCSGGAQAAQSGNAAVMAPVRAFYQSYNDGFNGPANFATDDWNHINPGGGRTQGKTSVLAEVRSVHRTFLKGVTDTIQHADVRFASRGVAVVTVVSRTSPFALPTDKFASAHDQIRTFVVVKRGGHWLVMQDQNTNMAGPLPVSNR
jgi:uncharacterized protein (TIGR02246 family)